MSTNQEQLNQELEELEQRRADLQKKILEADPKVIKRSKWDAMDPERQRDHLAKGGRIID